MPRHLMEHPEDVSVVRLAAGEDPPVEWTGGPFTSIIRTRDETSVVCLTSHVPPGSHTEGPFRVFELAGPLAFGGVGVFAAILEPLVAAGVSILGFSTYDTPWVLVPVADAPRAVDAWRRADFVVTPASLTGGSP